MLRQATEAVYIRENDPVLNRNAEFGNMNIAKTHMQSEFKTSNKQQVKGILMRGGGEARRPGKINW